MNSSYHRFSELLLQLGLPESCSGIKTSKKMAI